MRRNEIQSLRDRAPASRIKMRGENEIRRTRARIISRTVGKKALSPAFSAPKNGFAGVLSVEERKGNLVPQLIADSAAGKIGRKVSSSVSFACRFFSGRIGGCVINGFFCTARKIQIRISNKFLLRIFKILN